MLFTGLLAPAGIRTRMHITPRSGELWYGVDPSGPLLKLKIGYADGRVAETWLEVRLLASAASASSS
jgi:hypothetical protein